ncbi:MAG: molecular chaperone DnaJ [Fibromonadaceae bacterium]|jgi:molecular chaperone DnaJ|nr:molecular chaperone DnaJ [Fibromonadaceae bacterium]
MAKKDYYEILGVSKDASADDIKRAYKKLAIKYHPDKNPGDKEAENKFKEAAEAYDVLSDDKKKAQYDRFGHEGLSSGGFGGGFSGGGFSFEDIFTHFGDIFSDIGGFGSFSGSRSPRGRGGPAPGEDLQMGIALTLKEIAEGVVKKVRIKRFKACPDCNGKGGTGMKSCSTCAGKGQVRRRMQSIFGEMVNVTTCPDCGGTGETISNKCRTCSGQKRVKSEDTIEVKIPAGVASGNYLKLRGEGNASAHGGATGSLIVHIEEKNDDFFVRDGQNLFCKVSVPVYRLALGGEQRVPTLYGEVKVKISAGLQPGTQLRVRGQGLPGYNSDYKGDLFVEIQAHIPESLSSKEKGLYEELSSLGQDRDEKRERGLLDRIKEFFG